MQKIWLRSLNGNSLSKISFGVLTTFNGELINKNKFQLIKSIKMFQDVIQNVSFFHSKYLLKRCTSGA